MYTFLREKLQHELDKIIGSRGSMERIILIHGGEDLVLINSI